MNTNNRYANVEQIFNHIDNDGLLVGNNVEWAKEAVCKSDCINLDYFVPCSIIEEAVRHCEEKLNYYRGLGSIAQVECYSHFINLFNSMWEDPDET